MMALAIAYRRAHRGDRPQLMAQPNIRLSSDPAEVKSDIARLTLSHLHRHVRVIHARSRHVPRNENGGRLQKLTPLNKTSRAISGCLRYKAACRPGLTRPTPLHPNPRSWT